MVNATKLSAEEKMDELKNQQESKWTPGDEERAGRSKLPLEDARDISVWNANYSVHLTDAIAIFCVLLDDFTTHYISAI